MNVDMSFSEILIFLYAGNPLFQPYTSDWVDEFRIKHPGAFIFEADSTTEFQLFEILLKHLRSEDAPGLIYLRVEGGSEILPANTQISVFLRHLLEFRDKIELHISGQTQVYDVWLQKLKMST